ncbi:hypothetical protein ACTGU8_11810, partial [Streptococcus suis]
RAMPGLRAMPGGPVTNVRQIAHAGGTRLLFDLAQPAVIGDGGFDADGRRLTLSLQTVDIARFAAASAAGPLSFFPFDLGNWAARPRYKVSVPV